MEKEQPLSALFPRVDDERAVLLFNCWWDADGYFVVPHDLAAVFHQACARAGRTPAQMHGSFGTSARPAGKSATRWPFLARPSEPVTT
jgi:hypothetical protein